MSKISAFAALLMVGAVSTLPAFSQPVPQPAPRSEAQVETTQENDAPETETEPVPAQVDTRIYQSACPALMRGEFEAKPMPPIEDGRCGERSPLEVTAVGGIALSQPAQLNCRIASTLARWASELAEPATRLLGSEVKTLITSTGYQCRRRNNAPTGKVSEHGFANAIDITGFRFADGTAITLLDGWGEVIFPDEEEEAQESDGDEGTQVTQSSEAAPAQLLPEQKFLRQARDRACTMFTTVLGPESNPLHADHFHFDLGCHGRNCTYVICE